MTTKDPIIVFRLIWINITRQTLNANEKKWITFFISSFENWGLRLRIVSLSLSLSLSRAHALALSLSRSLSLSRCLSLALTRSDSLSLALSPSRTYSLFLFFSPSPFVFISVTLCSLASINYFYLKPGQRQQLLLNHSNSSINNYCLTSWGGSAPCPTEPQPMECLLADQGEVNTGCGGNMWLWIQAQILVTPTHQS